jgi:transcriptional regulator with XRE-family HTH domain
MLKINKDRVSFLMIKRGFTAAEFGDRMGYGRSRGAFFLEDSFNPGISTVGKIADALGVNWLDIMVEVED